MGGGTCPYSIVQLMSSKLGCIVSGKPKLSVKKSCVGTCATRVSVGDAHQWHAHKTYLAQVDAQPRAPRRFQIPALFDLHPRAPRLLAPLVVDLDVLELAGPDEPREEDGGQPGIELGGLAVEGEELAKGGGGVWRQQGTEDGRHGLPLLLCVSAAHDLARQVDKVVIVAIVWLACVGECVDVVLHLAAGAPPRVSAIFRENSVMNILSSQLSLYTVGGSDCGDDEMGSSEMLVKAPQTCCGAADELLQITGRLATAARCTRGRCTGLPHGTVEKHGIVALQE